MVSLAKPREGHASHDAFGDELLALLLEVTVGAAFLHGVDGTHAAIDLVGTALIEDGFARAFLGAREQAADHDGIRSGGEGLDHIAGEFDAAVADTATVHFTGGAGTFHDGGDLRNAHTGHDARGADGAGPDAHLHGVGAGLQHGAGAFIGRHVARDELAIRERALDGRTRHPKCSWSGRARSRARARQRPRR